MNKIINELVDKKLNNIFSDYPDTKDLNELREELSSDLVASAEDKFTGDTTENEAVDQAFKTFGDIDEVITQVLAESDGEKKHSNQRHGHHIDINSDGIKIDDGNILNINDDGIKINGGKTVEFNEDGIKIGNMTINEDGINFGKGRKSHFDKPETADLFDDFDEHFKNINFDTEINVESLQMTDEDNFEAEDIKQLNISYDSATIKLVPTSGDKIIFREYMSRNNPKYQAKTDLQEGTLTIIQTQTPHFLPLKIKAQLLIPKKFQGDITISSHSGKVSLQELSNLKDIKVSVNSGLLNVRDIQANSLLVKANSGKIVLEDLKIATDLLLKTGSSAINLDDVISNNYLLEANSGTIKAIELSGAGQIKAKSGIIKVNFGQITGDITVESVSGTVKLIMPDEASYNFDLEASSGIVKMGPQANYKHDIQSLKEGTVGDDPSFNLITRVKSGTIKVE